MQLYERLKNWVQEEPRKAGIYGGFILLLLLSFVPWLDVTDLHVSLAGERLIENGPAWSTNSLFTTIFVDIILIIMAFLATRKMDLIPSGFQNFMEAMIEYFYDLAESIAGKAASTYFPWCMTLFLFIVISNWFGLIPFVGSLYTEHGVHAAEEHGFFERQLAMADGELVLVEPAAEEGKPVHIPLFRAPTADLSTTFALAIATVLLVQYYGIQALGAGTYFKKFWNTSGEGAQKGINIFVGILEAISEVARVLTFSFRLFGNIFCR